MAERYVLFASALRASGSHVDGLLRATPCFFLRLLDVLRASHGIFRWLLSLFLAGWRGNCACKQSLLRLSWLGLQSYMRAAHTCANSSVVWSVLFQTVLYNAYIFLIERVNGAIGALAYAHWHVLCNTRNNISLTNEVRCNACHIPRKQFQPRSTVSLWTSTSRRIKSDTVMPSSLARFWSHLNWGSVRTTDVRMLIGALFTYPAFTVKRPC